MDLSDLLAAAPPHPRRVVCLTEETTETLYRIGAGALVAGVSGFTVRPPEARRKPRVSSFLSADAEKIAALRPDLVVGFSDLQADIARDLVRRGIPVLITNQRSVAEILQAIRLVAAAVGRGEAGEALCAELGAGLARAADAAAALPRRPLVFLEEWPDPLIAGIRWVSELLELCGGVDVCAERREAHAAAGRIFAPEEIARRAPEAIVASWCGKKVQGAVIAGRAGWREVPAVRDGQLYEVKSAVLLQPGPAALTDGLAALARVVRAVAHGERLPLRVAGRAAADVARVEA